MLHVIPSLEVFADSFKVFFLASTPGDKHLAGLNTSMVFFDCFLNPQSTLSRNILSTNLIGYDPKHHYS